MEYETCFGKGRIFEISAGDEGSGASFETTDSESSPLTDSQKTATSGKKSPEFYAQIGKKGGEAVREKLGSAFFAEIGKKGGEAVKRKHGPDYYSNIGKKGGEAPRRPRLTNQA